MKPFELCSASSAAIGDSRQRAPQQQTVGRGNEHLRHPVFMDQTARLSEGDQRARTAEREHRRVLGVKADAHLHLQLFDELRLQSRQPTWTFGLGHAQHQRNSVGARVSRLEAFTDGERRHLDQSRYIRRGASSAT